MDHCRVVMLAVIALLLQWLSMLWWAKLGVPWQAVSPDRQRVVTRLPDIDVGMDLGAMLNVNLSCLASMLW